MNGSRPTTPPHRATALHNPIQVVELTPSIATLAGELCDCQPLRAYDAVQLASAISILPIITQSSETSLTFLSADDRLLNSAQLEHLQAANPNHYS